jgi:hypothetical protein
MFFEAKKSYLHNQPSRPHDYPNDQFAALRTQIFEKKQMLPLPGMEGG